MKIAKVRFALLILFLIIFQNCSPQTTRLQSAKHGLDLIYANIPKEEIINDVKFIDSSSDKKVDILRFDNVGEVHGDLRPLIISVFMPKQVDDLGLYPALLPQDSLSKLIDFVILRHSKITSRPQFDDGNFRITYRRQGIIGQYYVVSVKASSIFFKEIESKLNMSGNKDALKQLYNFLYSSSLIEIDQVGIKLKKF